MEKVGAKLIGTGLVRMYPQLDEDCPGAVLYSDAVNLTALLWITDAVVSEVTRFQNWEGYAPVVRLRSMSRVLVLDVPMLVNTKLNTAL